MEGIRQATEAEIEAIKVEADLGPGCSVATLPLGDNSITGVIRVCTELDPVFYRNAPPSRKAMFIWGIENMLRWQGVPFYYFNVRASDEEWQANVIKWGAEQVSKEPEFRYKKSL